MTIVDWDNILSIILKALPISVPVIMFLYFNYRECRGFEFWQKQVSGFKWPIEYGDNRRSEFSQVDWRCLMIDGGWGTGKTTYYEKILRYIVGKKPHIYISCFSSDKSKLVNDILQQQPLYKCFSLYGLLSSLFVNNWQLFMPKNRVLVFDDIERLHETAENYLDLIGIFDYLISEKCNSKLILIMNREHLDKNQIFNAYLERVVDIVKTDFGSREKILANLFQHHKTDKKFHENNKLTIAFLIKIISGKCYHMANIRIAKTIIKSAVADINSLGIIAQLSSDKEKAVYLECCAEQLVRNLSVRYLYFHDYDLFRAACNIGLSPSNDLNIHSLTGRWINREDEAQELKEYNKYRQDLQNRLTRYDLKLDVFESGKFRDRQTHEKLLKLSINHWSCCEELIFNTLRNFVLQLPTDDNYPERTIDNDEQIYYRDRNFHIIIKHINDIKEMRNNIINVLNVISQYIDVKQYNEVFNLDIDSDVGYRKEHFTDLYLSAIIASKHGLSKLYEFFVKIIIGWFKHNKWVENTNQLNQHIVRTNAKVFLFNDIDNTCINGTKEIDFHSMDDGSVSYETVFKNNKWNQSIGWFVEMNSTIKSVSLECENIFNKVNICVKDSLTNETSKSE
jgi:hypothetical protein